MAGRIDVYLSSLARFNASAVVLASGASVALRFPTGERFSNQTVSHADLLGLVEQIAPPAVWNRAHSGHSASFTFDHGGKPYSVTVEPGPKAWRVTIEPGKVPAAPAELDPPPGLDGPLPELDTGPPRSSPASLPEVAAPAAPAPAPAPAPAAAAAPAPTPAPERAEMAVVATGDSGPIDEMLIKMREIGASDLHLSCNNVPKVRRHGEIQDLDPKYGVIHPEAMMALLAPITPERNRIEFSERNDTDFAHSIPKVSRFRVNVFRDRHGPGAVMRIIPFQILSPQQLGLPEKVLELCFLSKGLVVVTGPTGSGKSTTLATMIDYVNLNRKDHLITIEDPIEFVHENKNCLVNQREIRTHTTSFKDALRAALREDPDIVLVGEMRDLETIAIAVETAETGHLVFGTLHTTTAPSTVDRVIDQFPSDRQDQVRQMLAESLRGVIAQTLCKKIGGGRIAAYEILIGSSAVSNLIREKKTFQLFSLMQTGKNQGMITLNDSLLDLVKKKLVEPKEAYIKAVNKTELMNTFKRENITVNLTA